MKRHVREHRGASGNMKTAGAHGTGAKRGTKTRGSKRGKGSKRDPGGQQRARASALSIDVLGVVMRVRPASRATIEALMRLKLVCKDWKQMVVLVVADEEWLAPVLSSGQAFLTAIPELLWQMNSRMRRCSPAEALVLRRSYVDLVQEHLFDAKVLCRALRGLVAVEGYRYPTLIPPGEVATLICRALQAHPADHDVAAAVLKLLVVVAEMLVGQDALLRAGAVPVLMAALARRAPCSAVVDAISSLVLVKKTHHTPSHVALSRAGVVPLLLQAMRHNFMNLDYQFACLRCVRVLSHHHEHAALLKREGVGRTIFHFMQLFSDNLHGHCNAVHTLLCLEARLTPGDGIDFFASNCGMQRVLAGVRQYEYNPHMVRAVQLLGCLQDQTRATTARLLELHVVRFVVDMMQIARSESMMESASCVLDRLSSHPLFEGQSGASEVLPQVLAMIKDYPDNANLQRYARKIKTRFQTRARQAAA